MFGKKFTIAALVAVLGSTWTLTSDNEYEIGSPDYPKSLMYMLDSDLFTNEDNFYQRMASSKSDIGVEEEDEVVTFGDKSVVVHKAQPKVKGLENFTCPINGTGAKFCTGGLTDITAWADFSQS